MIKILVNNIMLDNYFAKSDTIRLSSGESQLELLIKKTEDKFELRFLKDGWKFVATESSNIIDIKKDN